MTNPPPPDPAAQEPEPPPPPPAGTGGRNAQWIALGILLSRISGLVRDMFIARYFGTKDVADVWRTALRMPNVLQNLLGEGTLSASFIPVYTDLIHRGKEKEAGRLAGAIFALLFALAALLTLIGIAMAPVLVSLGAPGFTGAKKELAITCVRIVFPMAGVLVLSAWSLGVLNSHRRFFLPYVAPVLWNAAIIGTLFWFGSRESERDLVVLACWGAFVGGILQFLVQLPGVLRLQRHLKIRLNLRLQSVQRVLRTASHAIGGRGVVQISGWVDNILGSLMFGGAIAILAYAQTLYMLPVSLFGMSVAAAELPELARNRQAAGDVIARRVNAGLAQIAVLIVPSVVGYLLLGDVIVAALFERGEFTRDDTISVTLVLIAYSIGLLASTATRLMSSAFYAVQDTRTPARIAYLRVAVSAALGVLIILWIKFGNPGHARFGPIGLAAASSLGAWLEWSLLRRRLTSIARGIGLGRVLLIKLGAVALVAAAVARGITYVLPSGLDPILVAVAVLGPYAVIYLVVVHYLGIEARIPLIGRLLPARRRK
ncbi:MAG: murein biosynthesis integral membrane protein MurJ [Gemmatimonadota bacterium]